MTINEKQASTIKETIHEHYSKSTVPSQKSLHRAIVLAHGNLFILAMGVFVIVIGLVSKGWDLVLYGVLAALLSIWLIPKGRANVLHKESILAECEKDLLRKLYENLGYEPK